MFKKIIALFKKAAPAAQEQPFTEEEVRRLKRLAKRTLG